MVSLSDGGNRTEKVRALIDPCSESTLVSTRLARRLGNQIQSVKVGIAGVNGQVIDAARLQTSVYIKINPELPPVKIKVYGLKHIGITTPPLHCDLDIASRFGNLKLADPDMLRPGPVDAILGANIYGRVILPSLIKQGDLVAQKTVFGWVFTGTLQAPSSAAQRLTLYTVQSPDDTEPWHEQLMDLVQKFWSIEEIPRAARKSREDEACESIFLNMHQRNESGRYVVPLPLKPGGSQLLGESLSNARSALASVHRRMRRDPGLSSAYVKFIDDYLQLRHMRELTSQELNDSTALANYIPHHGIWQRQDNGKKLRVVFNASSSTSTGHSLNNVLYPGPKLQNNLAAVVMRWRMHRVAYCADIRMMFRQIRILPNHMHLQRIIWSPSSDEPERHYVLLTVTYGETCAPYLALRALRQLCVDEGRYLPEAVDSIEKDLYVDDFLGGADDVESARKRINQLNTLLKAGGFELKKWVTNSPELLSDMPLEDRLRPSWMHLSTEGPVSELGIAWDPISDNFRFSPPPFKETCLITKRRVLSEIARFFDPAGWLTPITVVAKMFLQELWKRKLDWDQELTTDLACDWRQFRNDLHGVSTLALPRWLGHNRANKLQLHAFSDASSRALAAAVYASVFVDSGSTEVHLVMARGKLASLKDLSRSKNTRMTIPRLELRAALLAAQLLQATAQQLNVALEDCRAWTDSQVVLHWLRSEEPVGNDLVDNYVSHVQEIVPKEIWDYVPSAENPVDIATRGTSPSNLAQNQLWWHGPAWLTGPPQSWPSVASRTSDESLEPRRPSLERFQCLSTQIVEKDICEQFSNLLKLLRTLIRCRRLLKRHDDSTPTPLSPLTAREIDREFLILVRARQQKDFPHEVELLKQGKVLPKRNRLRRINPFLDSQDVLRVGGRLLHSNLSFDEQHPVILDGHCHLSGLMIDWAHTKALHGGFRLTYSCLVRRAWIIGGRSKVKARLRTCTVCLRLSKRPMTQQMASLPPQRVTPARPFSRTGVDYAGPFQIHRSKGRGIATFKAYVAVFVCLVTKAIHLELVGDLTTASFLGALARFIGRRGKPTELWSDNSTTFHGADAELRRLLKEAEIDWGCVADSLAKEGIDWRFIPPSTPHFGGIWEAGVKSVKTHLRRIAGSIRFTYEEFYTLLVEIEMILNCRPLTPLSGDLEDLDVLTPAHFLVGSPLTSIPKSSSAEANLDRLSHWELVQGTRDKFWTRWSREYLNTLQQRTKWTSPQPNLSKGDVVILLDPSLLRPNGQWPLGRILEVYPGPDGLVRVASVRTASGTYTRAISKLARILTHNSSSRTSRATPSTAGGS